MVHIDIQKVAQLARLSLTPEEIAKLKPQLEGILEHVRQMDEVDLKGVEPVSHPFNITNVFRADEPTTSLGAEELLRIAPAAEKGMFRVPQIIESK